MSSSHLEYGATQPKPNNLLKVAFVGVCFTSLFTAYIAAQNLAAYIYATLGFDGLGSACVLNIYLFLAIGSVFASHVKRSLSHKAGFLIGSSCYTLFVLAGLYTASCDSRGSTTGACSVSAIWAVNLVATSFVGVGAAILWLTQSDYVNQCADESTKGLYNGVFWSLMQLSQIIGSILATVLMKATTTVNLYLVLFAFGVLSVAMFACTPQISQGVSYNSKLEEYEPLSSSVMKFFNTLTNRKYTYLKMGMILIGVVIGYYANLLSQLVSDIYIRHHDLVLVPDARTGALVPSAEDQVSINGNIGYALIALALGEVSAGLAVGKLGDAMKKINVLHICILIGEVALALCFIADAANFIPFAFAAGFIWGFCDTGLNTIVGSIIGAYYDGALELFSMMRFLTGIGGAATSGLVLIIGASNFLLCSVIIAGIIGLLHMIFIVSSRGLDLENKDNKHSLLGQTEAERVYA